MVLLKSAKCAGVVRPTWSLRARTPSGLRVPVDATALVGGEGNNEVSGDTDSRAMSGEEASL